MEGKSRGFQARCREGAGVFGGEKIIRGVQGVQGCLGGSTGFHDESRGIQESAAFLSATKRLKIREK